MGQTIQMVGALIVLSGFIANQWFGLSSDSVVSFVGLVRALRSRIPTRPATA